MAEDTLLRELENRIGREKEILQNVTKLLENIQPNEIALKKDLMSQREKSVILIEALQKSVNQLYSHSSRHTEAVTKHDSHGACNNPSHNLNPHDHITANGPPPPAYHIPKDIGPYLFEACSKGDVDRVNLYFSKATIEDLQHEEHGKTALHVAVENNNFKIVDILLHHSASDILIAKTDSHGKTPLHIAALKGNNAILKRLIAAKASVNRQDHEGNTVLHDAALSNNEQVVEPVLEAGANTNVRNKHGKLPQDLTRSSDIVKMITLHSPQVKGSVSPVALPPSDSVHTKLGEEHLPATHSNDPPPAYSSPEHATTILQLPPGWEKRIDPRTHKIFYIDHNTKTTHWKPPADAYYIKRASEVGCNSEGVGPDRRMEIRAQEKAQRAKREKFDPLDELEEEDWW